MGRKRQWYEIEALSDQADGVNAVHRSVMRTVLLCDRSEAITAETEVFLKFVSDDEKDSFELSPDIVSAASVNRSFNSFSYFVL